jgi:predicted Fe-Mo cluster-binding NifX family protein
MKIVISAQGKHLNSKMDPRFGRSPYFLIVDIDTWDFNVVSNPNIDVVGGAGIQSAQLIIEKGVDLVITGHCGPNAFRVLEAAGIKIYEGAKGTVKEAIQAYKKGQLKKSLTAQMGRGKGKRKKLAVWLQNESGGENAPNKINNQDLSRSRIITKGEEVRLVKEEIQDLKTRLEVLNQKLGQMKNKKTN